MLCTQHVALYNCPKMASRFVQDTRTRTGRHRHRNITHNARARVRRVIAKCLRANQSRRASACACERPVPKTGFTHTHTRSRSHRTRPCGPHVTPRVSRAPFMLTARSPSLRTRERPDGQWVPVTSSLVALAGRQRAFGCAPFYTVHMLVHARSQTQTDGPASSMCERH